MAIIAPSILSADFANLKRDVEMLNSSSADWIHVDIMDGVFVPNISFGFPVMKAIKKYSKKPLDVHLMIVHPENYIQQFKDAGADHLSVHIEACIHLHRTIQEIHAAGMKAGVAINPHTPVSALENIIADIDIVCMMTVNPGFGGQKFITAGIEKTARLKELILKKNSKALIEIDGGVDFQNKALLLAAGADVLVAGNTVFSAADPLIAIEMLRS